MRREEVLALIRRFGQQRILFHTYDDHYAFERLSWEIGAGAAVRALRAGPCARLLQKPKVRERLAQLGRSEFDSDLLLGFWPKDYRSYVIKLECWPHQPVGRRRTRQCQMARGDANLVVVLAFDSTHDRRFEELAARGRNEWIREWGHFEVKGRSVLSWARVDLELGRKEALIEEIQSDWVRDAREDLRAQHLRVSSEERVRVSQARTRYYENVLGPHRRQWAESTLLATLGLLRERLGIERVWYYSFDTGCTVKQMHDWKPPRSYYTGLPKRFCMQKIEEGPEWIEELPRVRRLRSKAKHPWQWWRLG